MIKQNCRFTADICQICDAYYLQPSNPLLPRSDKHLISPCNITPESNIKVMSCEKETLDCWTNSSWASAAYEMKGEQYVEYGYWF